MAKLITGRPLVYTIYKSICKWFVLVLFILKNIWYQIAYFQTFTEVLFIWVAFIFTEVILQHNTLTSTHICLLGTFNNYLQFSLWLSSKNERIMLCKNYSVTKTVGRIVLPGRYPKVIVEKLE